MVDGVRLAGKGDELALRRLSAACPMVGPVGYCLEREPNFFALTEMQGDDAEVGVIDGAERGTLDAMATSVRVVRRLAGGSQVLRYLADFKVHPRARGNGLAGRLMHLASEKLEREKVPAFGIVLGGNQAMSPLLERAGARLRFHPMARLRNHSVFVSTPSMPRLVGRQKFSSDVTVQRVDRDSTGELVELWNRVQARRELSPSWDERSLLNRTGPGDPLERFWIARRGGRAVGCAAAWDASQIKQLRVQSLSGELVWVRRLYNVMARRSGRAVIPADGELVPFVFITHFCAETPDDLRALLLRIREDLDPSTHLYFDIAFDVADPLARALDGFWKTSLEFGLYWITPPGIEPPDPLEKPVYFDMAFV